MTRDPICGMPGTIAHAGEWFCSSDCMAEFERRKPHGRTTPWRQLLDPWVWAALSGLAIVVLGALWPPAAGISAHYVGYLKKILFPFALGLLIGGVIDQFVPREYIARLLAGPPSRVIVRSTLLGFLASSCSHGCIALTVELYRKGASAPAAISFLLASPWASMALTLMLLNLFGGHGLLIVLGALGIACLTGFAIDVLARRGLLEANPNTMTVPEHFSIRADLLNRIRNYRWSPRQLRRDLHGVLHGTMTLGRMVVGWVQFGLILSVLLGSFVPHDLFLRYLGPTLGGLLMTLVASTAVEVCSEGTAPVAFELYRHTGALGNAFAFLMGGVVTDYTELAIIWKTIGKRAVLWLLGITLPLVIAAGWLLNQL